MLSVTFMRIICNFYVNYVLTIPAKCTNIYKHVYRSARVCFCNNDTISEFETEVYQLANIKSAKKRILVNRTKAARNKSIRSAVKTSIKKVEAAVQKNNKAAAQAALTEAISTISKATSKGVYHKNNCARKISRLTKAVNSIG